MKKSFEFVKNNFFLFTSIVLVGVYLFYFYQALILKDFMPSRCDPIGYYLDIKSFFENSSIQSPYILDEDVAPFGGAGVHGPGYAIFYGIIAKIFGFHHKMMIWLNLLFLVSTFLLLWKSKNFNRNDFFLLLTVQLAYFITLWSSFSYTPELINIVFANLTALQLIKISISFEKNNNDLDRQILIYTALILVASFFRYSWVIAIFGILPFSKSNKSFFKYLFISFSVFILGILYNKFFHSYYYGAMMTKCTYLIKAHDFAGCGNHILNNVIFNLQMFAYKYYYSNYYFLTKILIVFVSFLLLKIIFKERKPLALSVLLVLLMNFLSLITIWDAYDTREIRGLTPSLITAILVLIFLNHKRIIVIFAILFFLVFPTTLKDFNYKVFELSLVSGQIFPKFNLEGLKALQPRSNSKIITVLVPEQFFWTPMPNRTPLTIKDILHTKALAIPLKNYQGVPIRYTSNNPSLDPYYLHKKIKVDYVLDLNTLQLIPLPV
jgi:hypothetical protein